VGDWGFVGHSGSVMWKCVWVGGGRDPSSGVILIGRLLHESVSLFFYLFPEAKIYKSSDN
jgi:hypothetical protein